MKAVLLFAAALAFAQSPANFTATGPTTLPRRGHTATLLADGKSLDRRRLGT